jgi:3-isopropylmalate/(R)-2-methylmalate dehydratase large subunit
VSFQILIYRKIFKETRETEIVTLKMGMTITEKILSRASGQKKVCSGDIIWCEVDIALTHEALGPWLFENEFKMLGNKIWDPKKVVVTIDHYNYPTSVAQAEKNKVTLKWTKEHGIEHVYAFDGPSHQMMIEHGHNLPGTVIVGTDSHTVTSGAFGAFATGIGSTEFAFVLAEGKTWFKVPPSWKFQWEGRLKKGVMAKDMALQMIKEVTHKGANYKAVEFAGSTVEDLSIDGRAVLCNMSVEMGAKNGIINPDAKIIEYLKHITTKPFQPLTSDPDAEYEEVFTFEAEMLEPLVACPHNVDNVKHVREVEGIELDQVVIGTCTGGRYEDLEIAARILKNHRKHPNTRLLIIPASWKIYRECLRNGLIDVFLDAGACVANPGCGPCAGLHQGLLASGEVCLSSQNRNFIGRMGSTLAEIYLASPATCAASAIEGKITDPRKYL